MRITVGEKSYNNASWSFNERGYATLALITEESIAEIASAFDGEDEVRAYDDNDVETGVWYVNTLMGIYENYESHTEEEYHRMVVVTLNVTALTENAEAQLNGSIDENTDAILELAGLIADMADADIRLNRIESALEGIPSDIVAQLSGFDSRYNDLADRIARLENAREGS